MCWTELLLIIQLLIYRVIQNDCEGFNNLPPRSPDAAPCDFFPWGYVKDQVYVPPLTSNYPVTYIQVYSK